jgi:hypothetical protein
LDPIKIVIFLAVFALLLVVGRMLSAYSEVHAAQLPYTASRRDAELGEDGEDKRSPQPALTGADIEFPIALPPITRLGDGLYNRPIVRNYYFAKIDLVRGPDDPDSFCDEFYIELQDPESEHVWTYDYTVASPAGLQQVMNTEKFDSLYLAGNVVIVVRWDLRMILQTIMDEVMKAYGPAGGEGADQLAGSETSKLSRWGHKE